MKPVIRLAAFLTIGSALALTAPAQSRSPGKPRDPNQMVCEKQTVLGSRLAVRRVCMTRAEWAERRQLDREIVHRTQTQLCVAKGGLCTAGD